MNYQLKISAISLSLALLTGTVQAQLAQESLLFSQTQIGGSARMQAIGGAQTSLGGDVSSIFSNPAGLGFYNRSELSFTPTLNFNNTNTSYAGLPSDAFRLNFGIGQLGVVIHSGKDDIQQGPWRGGAFGISYNRTNSFNSRTLFEGQAVQGDLTQYLLNQADGKIPFTEIGAFNDIIKYGFDHYLINPDPAGNGIDEYYAIVGDQLPDHEISIINAGSQSQWSFSYGANYNDKVYLGAGIGIASLRYRSDVNIFENFGGNILLYNEITERYRANGSGVNATLGITLRPVDFVTVGVSYATPTFYTINSEYSEILATEYNNYYYAPEDEVLTFFESRSPVIISNYTLKTPSRLNVGASVFINKSGFITGDIEMVNYGASRISAEDFSVSNDNREIQNLYGNVLNIRVGGEYRIDMFRFRLGYAQLGNPYKINDDIDRSNAIISGGIGIKQRDYFVDFTIANSRRQSFYSPFGFDEGAVSNHTNTTAVLTVGFTF